jgi:hypothetical protein
MARSARLACSRPHLAAAPQTVAAIWPVAVTPTFDLGLCTVGSLHSDAVLADSWAVQLDSLGERTLAELVERRRTVTARSVDRLIKVARTVADLLGQDDIDAGCLLEAAGFRDVDPLADLASEIAQLT